jgi:hypothetical protein
MSVECLWYDGESVCYHLLDFDPEGLSEGQVVQEARRSLIGIGLLCDRDERKMLESLYLLDTSTLKSVGRR